MKTHQLAFLRPDEIAAEMATAPVAYLPAGLIEWHGPHLPMGLDALNAENACLRAAEKAGGLVLPTLYFGTEREHSPQMNEWLGLDPDSYVVGMDFPKNSLPSMYCSEEMLSLAARDQLRAAVKFGFRLIIVISGHAAGTQFANLNRLAVEFSNESPAQVRVMLPFKLNPQGLMEVGHATRAETSVMLALYPETVRLDLLPPLPAPLHNVDYAVVDYNTFLGSPQPDRTVPPDDDPRRASAEEGRRIIADGVNAIAAVVRAELDKILSHSNR